MEKTLGFLGTYNVDLSYSIKVKKPVMEFWFLVRRRRGIRKAQWEKISESHWAHNDRAEHGGKEREMEKRQMCSTIWEAPFALRNLMKNFFQQGKQGEEERGVWVWGLGKTFRFFYSTFVFSYAAPPPFPFRSSSLIRNFWLLYSFLPQSLSPFQGFKYKLIGT